MLPEHEYAFGKLPQLDVQCRHFRRVLGLHTSAHDAAAAIVEDGEVVEVVEFERIFREKRYRVFPGTPRFDRCLDRLFQTSRIGSQFDAVAIQVNCFRHRAYESAIASLKRYIKDAHYVLINHHLCHAAGGYFTSPFEDAAIFSYDGLGNEGTTVGFTAEGNALEYVSEWPVNFGMAYRALGSIVGGIHEFDNHTAGKTMGLTAYGKVIEAWKPAINRFISEYWPLRESVADWEPSVADGAFYLEGFGPVRGANTFGGPTSRDAQDFARTFQECWSEAVLGCVQELLRKTGKRQLCVVGGAALNAITNRQIANMSEIDQVHFIPNCNDSGIAMGAALYCYFAYQGAAWGGRRRGLSPYLGVPILDAGGIADASQTYRSRRLDKPIETIAELLAAGRLIGILMGRSELGPRALGNRSILCDARDPAMKTKLNESVKGREWYRPFAPVVRLEDAPEYFDVDRPVPYMSMVAFTRRQYRDRLGAVTHVDGSAGLQTVTREQHPFLWELLGHTKANHWHGCLCSIPRLTARESQL